MRVLAAFFIVLLGTGLALAQGSDYVAPPAPKPAAKPAAAKPSPAKPAAAKPKPAEHTPPAAATPTPRNASTTGTTNTAAPPPAKHNLPDAYAELSLTERMSLQSDLAWIGDYNGLINGEFSDRLVAAVKTFQRRRKGKETGILTPQERTELAAVAAPKQEEVGWRLVEDTVTGVRLGLPAKLATNTAPGESGTRWFSQQGQLQIETFRVTSGASLEAVLDRLKKPPPKRRISQSVLKPDYFVLSGMQGLKKFYIRASIKDGQIRGVSILYDQAMEGTMDSVVVAMSSAFVPFAAVSATATSVSTAPAQRRKVEYGTGIVVNAAGYIVTDRQVIDGCNVIVIPGHGNAERVAEDKSGDLALIRIYGPRELTPIRLIGATAGTSNVTLVGIADPQAQGGDAAVSTASARLGAAASNRPLDAAPTVGFSGAAAIDDAGQFAGMVVLKPTMVAGPAPAPQAAVVPREKVMSFLDANYVAPASGQPGVEQAKAAVVRVICVRK